MDLISVEGNKIPVCALLLSSEPLPNGNFQVQAAEFAPNEDGSHTLKTGLTYLIRGHRTTVLEDWTGKL